MGHFAKIVGGKVQTVIVAEPEVIQEGSQGDPTTWVQTSYNTRGGVHYEPNSDTPSADQTKALRKNFAGIGYTYDAERDAFIPPQPFASWTLNEETCLWDCPVTQPTIEQCMWTEGDDSITVDPYWDEDNLRWAGYKYVNDIQSSNVAWNTNTLSWDNI